jgi:hypothetical protein
VSRRTRLTLAIFGLFLIALSVAALVYASSPVTPLRDQAPLIPTLFVPPP